jgi:hypothetical protein
MSPESPNSESEPVDITAWTGGSAPPWVYLILAYCAVGETAKNAQRLPPTSSMVIGSLRGPWKKRMHPLHKPE